MQIAELVQDVRQYGDLFYLLVFAWTFVEGETIVLVAAAAAKLGAVDVRALFLCAWAGTFLGDLLWFTLFRRFGPRLISRFPRVAPRIEKAGGILERHATFFILTYRFVYGVRNVAALAIALSPLPWRRFAMLNFVSSGIWATVFCLVGYMAGGAIGGLAERFGWIGIAAVAAGGLSAFAAVRLRSRLRARRALEKAAAGSPPAAPAPL